MCQAGINELINKIRQKEEAAFRQLVLLYQSKIYVFAFRMLCNEDDADDAVQEIFIKVWKGIEGYKTDYSFNTWLYSMANNYCCDILRKRKRQPRIAIRIDFAEAFNCITETDIEKSFSNKHLAAVIWKLTQNLPDKQKAVFVLKELEGLDVSEISAITKLSPQKIKSNLYVARNAMRKLLTEILQDEQD